jgi:putative membrane protein
MTGQNIRVKYSSRGFTALTFRGTVILHALPKAIFFTLWATLVTCLTKLSGVNYLSAGGSLITIIGTFISLLLVFRTNTAYDRYWEGRKLWASMTTSIRSTARYIWVNTTEKEPDDVRKKKIIIDLLCGFPFAIKHYLREEYGIEYEDMDFLKHHVINFNAPSSIEANIVDLPYAHPSLEGEAITIDHGALNAHTNIPIAILYKLTACIDVLFDKGNINSNLIKLINAYLHNISDCLSGFERILRTPIPTAYSVHLSQSLWIFCLSIPIQLIGMLGGPRTAASWGAIPFTTVSTFVLFGILNIGEEIENPFGYDENDLPLDDYCFTLKQEIITNTLLPYRFEDIFAKMQVTLTTSLDSKETL